MSDLQQFFATDPLKLSEQNFEEIIKAFRGMRGQFTLGNIKAGSTKPKTEKQKATTSLADKLGLDLDL